MRVLAAVIRKKDEASIVFLAPRGLVIHTPWTPGAAKVLNLLWSEPLSAKAQDPPERSPVYGESREPRCRRTDQNTDSDSVTLDRSPGRLRIVFGSRKNPSYRELRNAG